MIKSQNTVTSGRKNSVQIIIFLLFLILSIKLYNIQIVQHNKYVGIADANRIRVLPLEAPRGIIYDRNGEIIAENKFQYNINVIPFEFNSSEKNCEVLSEIIGISKETITKRIRKNYHGRFVPAKILEDIDFEILTKIEEHKLDLPGVLYTLEPLRSFPVGINISHVIGYLREVSKKGIENSKDFRYYQGDLIGWKGIEKQYEKILRGKRGFEYVQVNALGQEVGNFHENKVTPPIPGKDLHLTIDLGLQKYAEELMEGKQGVVIMMNPENGQVLAMLSKPDYSPNLFSGIIDSEDWNKLRNDTNNPLYNRITQGLYPPGSVFKMLAAITALEKNIIDRNHKFYCPGHYRLGRRTFHCWNEHGHGYVDMITSIEQSCNVYYYNLIRKIGNIDLWASTIELFGFGSRTGIDLPNEKPGTLPNTNFLNKKYGVKKWTEGNKLNQVIGQGDVLVSPVQLAKYISGLSTRGKLVQPHLGLKYRETNENGYIHFSPEVDSITSISVSTWEFIEKAMGRVVYAPRGTAHAAKVKEMKVFGKTGTAENPHGETHAWFIGWAENDSSKVSGICLVEHGGHGGSTAAPIIGKLFEYYRDNIVD